MSLCAAPRAARLLRGALESSTLLASRGFGSSAPLSIDAAGPTSASDGSFSVSNAAAEAWPEATSGAAADALASAAATASTAVDGMAATMAATSDVGSVLGAAMAAVDGLHATSGLPWWATITAVGVLVRTAMLPVSLQGMKASAALMPLLRQAREEVSASMRPPPSAAPPLPPPPGVGADADKRDASSKQQRWQRAQQRAAAAAQQHAQPAAATGQPPPPPPPLTPSNAAILARFQQLRRQAGAPHPIWVLASPLAQLPVFITSMAAIRTMSLNSWPGFTTGGTAWFNDLTLPAMDLAAMSAPLGTAGVVLPMAIALSMFANIDAAFSVPAGTRQQASVMLYVMGGMRLLLEWMTVPLFAIALQLPQGALCYWATSSGLALIQNHALKQPAVRQLVGLPTGEQPMASQRQGAAPPAPAEAAAAAAAVAAGAAGPVGAGVDPALRHFLQTTSDQAALFDKAAALRSEGRAGACSTVLNRLLQLYPGQPNALYALGQVHAALKDWPLSEQYFLQAAQNPQLDTQSRSRSWFGAAVALHMQHEDDTAIDAFKKAAQAAQTDELRVRCWVSQAAVHRKLGQTDAAVKLLRKAARAEPKVEEAYLKPLLAELAGEGPPAGSREAAEEGQDQQQLGEQQAEQQQVLEAKRPGDQ